MRISDWSSDVCSSDLAFERLMHVASVVTPNLPELETLGGEAAILRPGCHLVAKGGHAEGREIVDRLLSPGGRSRELRDRKSVVSGKSVSVRVDLGGRRIINKKNR